MFTLKPRKIKRVELRGAVQINKSSFFVCSDGQKTFLKTGSNLKKSFVKNMLDLNPKISKLLKQYRIRPSIDTKILKELSGGHMNETCNIANGVYACLPQYLREKINKNTVKEAAMLHDVGKVLIPSKILNKPAKLNIKEREIMNIHSLLGYELLKTQRLPENTLELIKYHHQNLNHSGYPEFQDGEEASDIEVQIVSISDKYSALREARVYRRKLSCAEALLILYGEVREGKILPEVYNALLDFVTSKYIGILDNQS